MDLTRSNPTGAAPLLRRPESNMVGQPRADELCGNVEIDMCVGSADITPGDPGSTGQRVAYGLPCAKCHLYYLASLAACPWCKSKERVSPELAFTSQIPVPPHETNVNDADLDREREAFLQQFNSQLDGLVGETAKATIECQLSRQHPENSEPASICKPCYERLQQRVDVLEAALHIDLKEAAQIVYQAVWADPSDPAKTYANAAAALLTELRKRAGVSSVLGPFQPRGN